MTSKFRPPNFAAEYLLSFCEELVGPAANPVLLVQRARSSVTDKILAENVNPEGRSVYSLPKLEEILLDKWTRLQFLMELPSLHDFLWIQDQKTSSMTCHPTSHPQYT